MLAEQIRIKIQIRWTRILAGSITSLVQRNNYGITQYGIRVLYVLLILAMLQLPVIYQ